VPSRYSRRDFGPSNYCPFGPAAPSRYSRRGFGPSNCPSGLAAPSRYSGRDFGPSNCFFRASSAFKIFEAGLRSLELSLLSL
jgi:hypothetical protein